MQSCLSPIVNDCHFALSENLDSLFVEVRITISDVHEDAYRTIIQFDCGYTVIILFAVYIAADHYGADRFRKSAAEVSYEIDEMTSFTDDPPPALLRVLIPGVGGDWTCIYSAYDLNRADFGRKKVPNTFRQRTEATVKAQRHEGAGRSIRFRHHR